MGLSKLSAKCRACPFVLTCEHKQMEALAYLEPAKVENMAQNAQPLSLPAVADMIHINAGDIQVTIRRDELEKRIYKALTQPFMMNGA